jgi:tetratricopeptide (TPR) repeat protein
MLPLLLLPHLLGTVAAVPAVAVQDYTGKYQEDPRYEAAFHDLQARADAALLEAESRMWVPRPKGWNPTLRIEDAAAPRAPEVFKGFSARTSGMVDEVVVTVHPEFVVNGQHQLDQLLVHEMSHALLRSQHVRGAGPVSRWVVEGLGIWAARELEAHYGYFDTQGLWTRPDKAFGGLNRSGGGVARYLEYGLAIECLESRVGVEGVQALAVGIATSRKPYKKVEKAAGAKWKSIVKDLDKCVKAEARNHAPEGLTDFIAILATKKNTKDPALVLKASREFLEKWPESRVAPLAFFHAGRALEALGETEDAIASLEAFLEMDSKSTFRDDSLMALANLTLKQSPMTGSAYAALLLLDHPDSPRRDHAIGVMSLATASCGRTEEALEMLNRHMKDVPDKSLVEKAVEELMQIPVQECSP